MVKRWSKIFHYGDMHTTDIFEGRVQITEKLDGSQINWGIVEGNLVVRSKGSDIALDSVPDLFKPAVDHLKGVTHLMVPGFSYHGETLCRPKHNILQYKRVPQNYIALYGVTDDQHRQIDNISDLKRVADNFGIETVQEFFAGRITGNGLEYLDKYIAGESQLGGPIEGVVIKSFGRTIKHGADEVLMQAKYVSNDFKERAQRPVKILKTRDPVVDRLAALARTEARYLKAVQRLNESGTRKHTLEDIGPLLKELHKDIDGEDKHMMLEEFWKENVKDIKRSACKEVANWYKGYLTKGQHAVSN